MGILGRLMGTAEGAVQGWKSRKGAGGSTERNVGGRVSGKTLRSKPTRGGKSTERNVGGRVGGKTLRSKPTRGGKSTERNVGGRVAGLFRSPLTAAAGPLHASVAGGRDPGAAASYRRSREHPRPSRRHPTRDPPGRA